MARRKTPADALDSEENAGKDGKKPRRSTPSVHGFLSKISSAPRAGRSAAKGLLGDITREDLAAVRRLESGLEVENPAPAADVVFARDTEPFEIEITTDAASGRKEERTRLGGSCEVRGVFSSAHASKDDARIGNVSPGGVFVETAQLLEVGDPVMLSFPLDDGKRLTVNGRVRWVTPFGRMDDPTPGMGIEFVGVEKSARRKLDSLLRTVRPL